MGNKQTGGVSASVDQTIITLATTTTATTSTTTTTTTLTGGGLSENSNISNDEPDEPQAAPAPLTSLSYWIDLLEEPDYKYVVLHLLSDKNHANRMMCELRIALFSAAAHDENAKDCLLPFPACFFSRETKTKEILKLVAELDLIPKLQEIDENTELSKLGWQLLHWVFTNPLHLTPLLTDIPETIARLEAETKLSLPTPDNKDSFMFNILRTQPKKKFQEAKDKLGSYFTFHGSPTRNFHSIIHRGLMSSLNRRSYCGFGTYMSNQMEHSRAYATCSSPGWVNSNFGHSIHCVAVCEVVNSPEVKIMNFAEAEDEAELNFYICPNDELLQLSHLFLFLKEF